MNLGKLPGWLVLIPNALKDSSIVMKSISLDWELLVKVFKEAIERPPSKETLEKFSPIVLEKKELRCDHKHTSHSQ